MLTVSKISKQFRGADEPILADISFTVNAGERVALIGPNGSGKTTLLNIVMDRLAADSGGVIYNPPDLRIGYLAQGLVVNEVATVQEIIYPQSQALAAAQIEVERLATALYSAPDAQMEALMQDYGNALEELERLANVNDAGVAERMLAELDLAHLALDTPVERLSGGQKTRLGLAAILVSNPQLLILDEPTNHLDIVALEWLSGWLRDFPGGALIVSHDRTFLDETVGRIVAIDEKTHTARVFEGNYTVYVNAVRSERDKHWARWRDQQVEIARLQADVERTMARAVRKENATKNDQQRRYAKKVARRAKAKEKRLERYLESEERVDKPVQTWDLKLDFGDLPSTGQDVVFLENLSIGYKEAQPLLSNLNLTLRAGERVAVLGPNGHGKSTLLKTIIKELPPLAGQVRLGASVKTGYLAQEQDFLDPNSNPLLTLLTEVPFNETDARSFLHYFLFAGDDVFTPVGRLSYGERARLMLALLVARGANLLVLDEPINHLDVSSREQFERAMDAFQGSVLAVVHDRYFVDHFATTIWHIEGGVLEVEVREPILA